MKETSYITFDLETTGLDIIEDEPIQIYLGAAWGKKGKIADEFLALCYGDQRISPGAQAVHGISWESLQANGKPAHELTGEVSKFIWAHQPAILVGHNCLSFDFPMLQNWFSKYVVGRFKHAPMCGILDTMHLANMVLGGRKWRKLDKLAKELEIDLPEDLHDARTDGRLTWEICKVLLKGERG